MLTDFLSFIVFIIVVFLIWAQLRTADNTTKIRKLLEEEINRRKTIAN